jgi:hypothetical protein
MTRAVAREVPRWIEEPFEWWDCGEFEPMLDHYAEDAEHDFSAVFTDARPFRGRDSLRRQWEDMLETWEGLRDRPALAGLYTLRRDDNKAVRMQLFPTVEAAVEFASRGAG